MPRVTIEKNKLAKGSSILMKLLYTTLQRNIETENYIPQFIYACLTISFIQRILSALE